jgi:TIR domain
MKSIAYQQNGVIDVELLRLRRRIYDLRLAREIVARQTYLLRDDYEEAFFYLRGVRFAIGNNRGNTQDMLYWRNDKFTDVITKYDTTKVFGLIQAELEEASRRLVRRTNNRPLIFISYRRDDTRDAADQIYASLQQLLGSSVVFKDQQDTKLGTSFPGVLEASIKNSKIFLLLIGPQWHLLLKTVSGQIDWVITELELAVNLKLKIIPVLVNGASMPDFEKLKGVPRDKASLIARVGDFQALQYGEKRFAEDINLLVNAITDEIFEMVE